jgi:hypothetical protein
LLGKTGAAKRQSFNGKDRNAVFHSFQGAAEISRMESPSINPNLMLAVDFCREDTGENRQNFIRESLP